MKKRKHQQTKKQTNIILGICNGLVGFFPDTYVDYEDDEENQEQHWFFSFLSILFLFISQSFVVKILFLSDLFCFDFQKN